MKTKIRIVFVLLAISIVYIVSDSFAKYVTSVAGKIEANDENGLQFAKFIVDNNVGDSFDIDINDFNPGSSKEYSFYVANYYNINNTRYYADVAIRYNITINSYSLPLEFSLVDGNNAIVSLNCNGYTNVTCQTSNIDLGFSSGKKNNYKLIVSFPQSNNGVPFYNNYSNNIDKVHIKLNSWQNT